MNKQIIRLTERELKTIIKESIYRLLYEDYDREMSAEGDLVFYIPKCQIEEISHFLQKIGQVSNMAKKSDCGSIEVKTETVVRQTYNHNETKDESGAEYVDPLKNKTLEDVEFLKITIIPTVPRIQVPGYKYVGTITPMVLEINGEKKEHMMVALSEEFTGNDHYERILKQSSQVMKCDGCNRERARGIYFCFLDEKTGKVMKLGGSCAARFFGVDVATKVKNLFDALSRLGSESPYVIYDPDGDIAGQYIDPVMAELDRVLSKTERQSLEDGIMRGCWAIVEYGVNCYMKTSMGGAEIYESIVRMCARKAIVNPYKSNKPDPAIYKRLLEEEKKKNPKIFETRDKAIELMYEFMKNGMQVFYEMEPKSDFEKKIQDIGLLITGGMIQKRRINFQKYENFIPYCVQIYFQRLEAKTSSDSVNLQPIQPFKGYKKMNVTVNAVEKKQTKKMTNYYAVVATTDNNELVKWNVWNNQPDYKMGDKLVIVATYNTTFKTLDDVKTSTQSSGSESDNLKVIEYPDAGFKYINQTFTITRLTPKFLIVKNNKDNCEYYISNFKAAFSYYDTSTYKFDLNGLNEGSEITISGTVKSYQKENGTTGYSLIRVKGLPLYKGGHDDDDEDI